MIGHKVNYAAAGHQALPLRSPHERERERERGREREREVDISLSQSQGMFRQKTDRIGGDSSTGGSLDHKTPKIPSKIPIFFSF